MSPAYMTTSALIGVGATSTGQVTLSNTAVRPKQAPLGSLNDADQWTQSHAARWWQERPAPGSI
jgi:hypothetical protein